MTKLPNKAKVVIIGGGIHGLSTAWKLSETYKNPGDIIVLEKDDIAAGASGIADTNRDKIKKLKNKIGIECLIETALGMSNIKEIAKSSGRLEGFALWCCRLCS